MSETRSERDFLGTVEIPAEALWGVHTARAAANFPFSGHRLGDEPELVRAFAEIKAAAAAANRDLNVLGEDKAAAIQRAAFEVRDGAHLSQFVVDLLEGSGGTSLNMNVNEVLANRGLELLGRPRGDYASLHPNDDVNRSQSTNDVVPSAIKMAAYRAAAPLIDALESLARAFAEKAKEFDDDLKLGRTCLQDAQPMRLGQAFEGHATLAKRLASQIAQRRDELAELPLGGTAIGTGFGAPGGFRERVFVHLTTISGLPLRPAGNLFDAMSNADGFARFSAELRTAAIALMKIAEDFILLSSGPNGGMGELELPALQAGSSIMPGKINPVMPMALVQIATAVFGNDACVAFASARGQLEINTYEPVMASRLLDSARLLASGVRAFNERCVSGVKANREHALRLLLESSALATALVAQLGYERVAELVRRAQAEGRSFLEVAEGEKLLSRDSAIDAARQTTFG
jgi:aspartate ammonia-lyase